MAKHTHRKLTDAEREQVHEARQAFDADRDTIVAQGQALRERMERLQDAVRLLKAERQAQGLSLADMEMRCGMTRTALSRLENDPHPNPTVSTLARLAQALNVELTLRLERNDRAA
jgi:ribosome-binding protein aMBF1 (putative translation factor)